MDFQHSEASYTADGKTEGEAVQYYYLQDTSPSLPSVCPVTRRLQSGTFNFFKNDESDRKSRKIWTAPRGKQAKGNEANGLYCTVVMEESMVRLIRGASNLLVSIVPLIERRATCKYW